MSLETTLKRLLRTLLVGNEQSWEKEMIQYGNDLYEHSAE